VLFRTLELGDTEEILRVLPRIRYSSRQEQEAEMIASLVLEASAGCRRHRLHRSARRAGTGTGLPAEAAVTLETVGTLAMWLVVVLRIPQVIRPP